MEAVANYLYVPIDRCQSIEILSVAGLLPRQIAFPPVFQLQNGCSCSFAGNSREARNRIEPSIGRTKCHRLLNFLASSSIKPSAFPESAARDGFSTAPTIWAYGVRSINKRRNVGKGKRLSQSSRALVRGTRDGTSGLRRLSSRTVGPRRACTRETLVARSGGGKRTSTSTGTDKYYKLGYARYYGGEARTRERDFYITRRGTAAREQQSAPAFAEERRGE